LRYPEVMLPLWATIAILGIITTTGGFLVTYLMSSSRTLGRIDQAFSDTARRLTSIESWQINHSAEHVAYRNDYTERRRRR